jgi:hypothetical protein
MSRVEIRAFPKPGVYLFELDVAANGAVSAGPAVCTVFVPGLAGNVHRSPSDGVFGLSQGTVRAYSDYGSALNWTDHYLSSRSVAIAPLGDFALDNLATGACWIVAQGVTNASPPYLRYGPVRRVISYGSALGRMAVNISRSEVTFVGTVIDSRTQEPVENVRVAVVAGSLSEIFRTTTDRLGRFVIHAVPAGTQNVLFFADGYQAKTTQFSFSGPKTVKTVPLDPSPSMASAVLCGTVSSRYGGLVLPVAHAEVVLGSGVARTLTDAQGYYEIHGLQAGRIFGTIRKPGYRSTSLSDSLTVTLAPGTNRVDRELAYDGHGPVVRGVIVSDNSEPIPNVTVRVLDAAQKIRSAGSQRTDASEPVVSDAAGTFQLIGLADGDRTLELVFPDGHTRVEEVRVTGNMEWSAIVPTTARDPYAVWLARYYAIPYPTNRLDDTDGDGSTTREEFLWDTVPTNRTSRPPLTALDLGPDGWRLTVTPVSTARWYDAYWKTNLLQRTWWPCGPAQRGAGGPLSWVMTNRPAARRGFFCTGARIP